MLYAKRLPASYETSYLKIWKCDTSENIKSKQKTHSYFSHATSSQIFGKTHGLWK